MDLLASLHLDELPEQQTRTSHLNHEALLKNETRLLGFNACCTCASSSVSVECPNCRRVKYCSDRCRQQDSNVLGLTSNSSEEEGAPVETNKENDDENALGHSSVVCALLRLCQADETVEDNDNNDNNNNKNAAAQDRVRSEYESYPATLANILLDGPCYQHVLLSGQCSNKGGGELVIHVIGASVQAELWGQQEQQSLNKVWDAYSEALAQLAEMKNIQVIRLCFIGPDCPETNQQDKRRVVIDDDVDDGHESSYQFIATTHKAYYSQDLFHGHETNDGNTESTLTTMMRLPEPNVVVFFNPGFTCPDYDWKTTLACIKHNTPFLVTTNTQMEGMEDCQYLLREQHIASLPPVLAEGLQDNNNTNDENDGQEFFFGENPFAGSRVRQSGTMANDLFVKNRWMLGGIFSEPNTTRQHSPAATATSTVSSSIETPQKSNDGSVLQVTNKKKRKSTTTAASNTKRKNPALI